MGVDSRMRSDVVQVSPKKESKSDPVDREKTCPMLLRVFHSKGTFHKNEFLSNSTFLEIKAFSSFSVVYLIFQDGTTDQTTLRVIRLQTMNCKVPRISSSFLDNPKYSSVHLDGRNAKGDHEPRPRGQPRNTQERNRIPFRNRLSGKLRKIFHS